MQGTETTVGLFCHLVSMVMGGGNMLQRCHGSLHLVSSVLTDSVLHLYLHRSLYLYIYLSFSDLNTIIYPLILYNDLCTWIVTMHLVFSKC